MSSTRHGPAGRPTAVVVALDCITGLQTTRLLVRRGIPVVGIASDRRHFCARTRLAERIVTSPTSGEALIATLERLASSGSLGEGPAVLIPCSDAAVLAISRWRDRLEGRYCFVLPPHDTIELLMDKVRFAEHATAAGLPIPETHVLRDRADAQRAAASLTYPAVVKPPLKTARWQAATTAKVFRVGSAAELLDIYDRYTPASDVLIRRTSISTATGSRMPSSSPARSASGLRKPARAAWARRCATTPFGTRPSDCSGISAIKASRTSR
jgi:D-aspartate ligase